MSRIALIVCATACLVCISQSRLLAAEPAKLTVAEAEPPKEIAAPIRAVLDQKSLRLSSGDAPFFEFWFRKELPLAEAPENGMLDLGTIKEGTVLGAVKVDVQRDDFRKEEIPPGIYVLRYGIQPEDGNHQGAAPTRTFALMTPAKTDTKLDPVPHDQLVKDAATINAAKHPSNFNLQPVEKADGEFPRLEERSDGDHKVILLKFPARVAGAREATPFSFALVYEGTGHI